MKTKVLQILLISFLLTTTIGWNVTLAEEPSTNNSSNTNEEESSQSKRQIRRAAIQACEERKQCDSQETSRERRDCRQTCAESVNGTGEEESKAEYLPPISKPANLPGPTFADPNKRTGQEATAYVTEKLLPKVASRLITIIAIASMLGLVFSGIQFFTAMGETDKMQKARRAAMFSVVGLILALLSFTIVQIINLLPLST